MKTLLIYDSVYGNTEKIARAIGGVLPGEVTVLPVNEAGAVSLAGFDLFVVGSPTNGGRPTKAMQNFLDTLPAPAVKGLNFTAFDTRLKSKLVGIFGYAAGRIAASLKDRGGNQVLPPGGFFVKGTKGPLEEGELERAIGWIKGLATGGK